MLAKDECTAFKPFVTGNAERYTEYVAEFFGEPAPVVLVFSHLDGEHVRIAALPRTVDQRCQLSSTAMVGCAIDLVAFAHALADCFEECLEYTRRAYIQTERWADFTDEFEQLREEYDDYIQPLRAMDHGNL